LVIEALTCMRHTGAEQILVLEGNRQIGRVTFAELTNFLYDYEDEGNVYVHKLNFDLGTAMVMIREIRSREGKKLNVLKPLLTVVLILLSVALLFSKPLMRFVREVIKKFAPVEVVVPKKAGVLRKGGMAEPPESELIGFRYKPLEDIMNVLAVWYGLEVVYEHESLRKMRFGGSIGRPERVEWVFDMLQKTRTVSFRMEGKRVIVGRGRNLN
jgi:hypothetical protein